MNALLSQSHNFVFVVDRLRSNAACALSPRAAAAMEEATHIQSRSAFRDSRGGQKIRVGLACEAVSPLGSVAMPRSASFMQQTTA